MLDVNELSDRVMENLCKRLEDVPEDQQFDTISEMSVYKAFDEFLTWEGIIGYTGMLIDVYENIKAAEVIPKKAVAISNPGPNEEYLGDGLYTDYDGWQVCLAANDKVSGHPTDKVYLEPAVLQRLVWYAKKNGITFE